MIHQTHSCPFCGDQTPELKSGPCEYVGRGQFMAQVHCGHCGATGTRYAGEDSLDIAELRAVKSWNDATEGPRRLTHWMITASNFTIYLALFLIFISYMMLKGFGIEALIGAVMGAALMGFGARCSLRIRRQHADANYWDRLEVLQAQAEQRYQ